jgi:phosphoglycerate dehydrogenase-like enzyme
MGAHFVEDMFGPEQWHRLEELTELPSRRPLQDFRGGGGGGGALADVEILVTGWGCPQLDREALAGLPRLGLVVHTGSSVKPIVSDALWKRCVQVSSAASANAVPVAEYALAVILLANKGVFRAREDARERRRFEPHPWVARGARGNLAGTVGIVGFSRTGRRLVELLQPFDLDILVHDPVAAPSEVTASGAKPVSLESLFELADTVSIHAPWLPETKGMISSSLLARLRNGATVVNTARGALIDEKSLLTELRSGRLNAVLDVTDPEPPAEDSPLYSLPNVFLTPHMAGAAGHETRRLADHAIDEIRRFVVGEPLAHRVTPELLKTIG